MPETEKEKIEEDDLYAKVLDRLEQYDQRIARLEADNLMQGTQINAQSQALGAMNAARKNTRLLLAMDRKINSFACVITGTILIGIGVYFFAQNKPLLDDLGKITLFFGYACIGYGLLVLTGKEEFILQFLPSFMKSGK